MEKYDAFSSRSDISLVRGMEAFLAFAMRFRALQLTTPWSFPFCLTRSNAASKGILLGRNLFFSAQPPHILS